jgi:uncharacterized membrane protein
MDSNCCDETTHCDLSAGSYRHPAAAVTGFLLIWLGTTAERTLSIAIKWILPDGWYVTGMGVVAGIVLIFLIGLLVNIWGVPRLIRFGEQFVERIPLVKNDLRSRA